MATQNSGNNKFTNNADGFDVAGGTTARKLTVTGADMTLTGSGTAVMTFPATSATIARTDAGQTFTGVQTMTSPAITTPAITGLATGTGVATANTASTLVARDASGNFAAGTITAALTGTASGNLVSGGALGTPSSGTLTNATGLPVSGITASTVTALGVGSVELGHATDTTLSRSSAGVLAVEGVVIPSISSTNTFTNKRMTRRTGTTTSSATPTINTDNVDFYSLTAQAADITSFTTNLSGTPTENQTLWIAITGTAARAITWGTSFEASTVALPTTTVTTNRLDVGFVWNTVSSKWRCIAVA